MTGLDPHAGQVFLGNGFVTRKDLPLRDVVNPAALSIVGRTAQCTPAIIAEALGLAVRARRDWVALDGKSRAAALHRLGDAMEADTAGGAAELMTRAFRRSKMVMMDPKPQLQSWWYPYTAEFCAERGGRYEDGQSS